MISHFFYFEALVEMSDDYTLTPRMNSCYAVRISVAASEVNPDFYADFKSLCEGLVAVEHKDSQRPHIHLAFWNVRVTHDTFRKFIKVITHTRTSCRDLSGNSLLSVKKWDGHERYLIYMLKGEKAPIIFNKRFSNMPDGGAFWVLSDSRIKYLRQQWVSESIQENFYVSWSNSPHFPQAPAYDHERFLRETEYVRPTIPFDTVRQKALDFILPKHGGYVSAKVRYEVKDLVSNYCLFNKIKMLPLHI